MGHWAIGLSAGSVLGALKAALISLGLGLAPTLECGGTSSTQDFGVPFLVSLFEKRAILSVAFRKSCHGG